jgi:hypothetical protein
LSGGVAQGVGPEFKPQYQKKKKKKKLQQFRELHFSMSCMLLQAERGLEEII